MTNLDLLVDLEKRGWQALADGEGGPYYREHLTDDALMAFPFGVLSREATISAMESARPSTTYDIQEPRVITLTPGQRRGPVPGRRAADRQALVQRDDQQHVRAPERAWKLAFHQQTPA